MDRRTGSRTEKTKLSQQSLSPASGADRVPVQASSQLSLLTWAAALSLAGEVSLSLRGAAHPE